MQWISGAVGLGPRIFILQEGVGDSRKTLMHQKSLLQSHAVWTVAAMSEGNRSMRHTAMCLH